MRVYGCLRWDLALRLRHSAKFPEYMPQVLSFGDTALIKIGHVMSTIGKFIENVGMIMVRASADVNSCGRIVYCQIMYPVPTRRLKE